MTETTTGKSNDSEKAKTETTKETQPAAAESGDAAAGTAAAAPKEMRAIVVQNYGGLKSVKVLKKAEPSLSENQVLIRVKACGLNFPDLMVRQGLIESPLKAPFILGSECSGVVEAVGEGVEDIKVGDRVAALTDSKAYAELVAVSVNYVYPLPEGMSFHDAVAITMNYVVAYCLLFDIANLQSGQTVFIHSVGGGVGHALTQLAKRVSDVTIIGTASKHKHEALKDNVTHLLDHSVDYVQEVKNLSPNGVDLFLDCLYEDATKGYNLLKPLGRYILYGRSAAVSDEKNIRHSFKNLMTWWHMEKVNPMKLYEENRSYSGFNLRKLLFTQNKHEYIRSIVEKIYALYNDKSITPVIDSTFAFEDVAEAMQKLHDRKNIGKVILDPSMEPKPRPPEEENTKSGKRKSSAKDKDDKKEDKNKESEKSKETKETKESKEKEAKTSEEKKEETAEAK